MQQVDKKIETPRIPCQKASTRRQRWVKHGDEPGSLDLYRRQNLKVCMVQRLSCPIQLRGRTVSPTLDTLPWKAEQVTYLRVKKKLLNR